SDEAAREEFQRFHKLKRDPRITAFGRWLRKTSLDELPQLWNVVKGNMTLVGPRPILPSEIDQYGYEIPEVDLVSYTSVRPGVTGLWQVTVRAEEEFSVRMQIDRYYVRNWSLFLDLYIVLRTVGVVVFGRGGY
ncbi:MAG TPA: undecaprenyl-phosphate galactose phosphotransferase WbaP, partial [Bacteroidetes bacterium]|nr:undecaprenyl-phosphate galactose phosphotransferase WbaP [Bacteroidota bacterium]